MAGSGRRARVRMGSATLGALVFCVALAVAVPGASARALHGTLAVTKSGTGTGTVVGRAASQTVLTCGLSCSASVKDPTDPGYSSVTLKATPDPGSVFKGWSGACSGKAENCVVEIQRLVRSEVNARFDLALAPSYPVTVALSGSGRVSSEPPGIDCGATCAASFATESTVTLSAVPNPGWTFAGWSGACTGTGTCALTIDGQKAVTASFSPPSVPLAVSVAGEGTVVSLPTGLTCAAACTAGFPTGSTVRLTAEPAPGATFLGWAGPCTGSAPVCDVALASGAAVTATFSGATRVPLAVAATGDGSVSSSPPGIACGDSCGALFTRGARVTLTARPASGAQLARWGQGCSGAAPTCVVTLSAARAVTAVFVAKAASQPLAVTTSGRGRVTSAPPGIDCGKKCTANPAGGSTVRLTATPSPRNGFVRWTGGCSGSQPVCVLRMTAPRSATALFAPLADQLAPRVRALPSSGRVGTAVRLRYRVTDGSGLSREWATVLDGTRRIGSVKGRLDEADPEALFNFLTWSVPSTVPPGRYAFCVWAVDPSGNVAKRSCSTLQLS